MTAPANTLAELLAEVENALGWGLDRVDWAEDEIDAAQLRHPAQADRLYHGFALLVPPKGFDLAAEVVFRSYCRELLDRLAAGWDTREATDAEVALACRAMSLVHPLNPGAMLVYQRAWLRAFPQHPLPHLDMASYEHIASPHADELDALIRRRLQQPGRVLPKHFTCRGRHSGIDRPDCRYAARG
jgi:hypothetical protein